MTKEELMEEKKRDEIKENLPRKLLKTITQDLGSEGVSVEDIEDITSEMIRIWKSLRVVPD